MHRDQINQILDSHSMQPSKVVEVFIFKASKTILTGSYKKKKLNASNLCNIELTQQLDKIKKFNTFTYLRTKSNAQISTTKSNEHSMSIQLNSNIIMIKLKFYNKMGAKYDLVYFI